MVVFDLFGSCLSFLLFVSFPRRAFLGPVVFALCLFSSPSHKCVVYSCLRVGFSVASLSCRLLVPFLHDEQWAVDE